MKHHSSTMIALWSTMSLILCATAWSQNPGTPASEFGKARLYVSPSTGIQYAMIPAGRFVMGSNKGNADEVPVHEEAITAPFYLGIYEVTQEQWQNIIGDKLPNRSAHKDPTNLRLPVEYLSLSKAQEFCKQLTGKEGRLCRLPTEVEWEYACRAGTISAYYLGESSDDLEKVGWYAGNAASQTHEVGLKPPNAWGLFDMHGNVWEWCDTRYFNRYDRHLNTSGTWVARGGSANSPAQDCRSACRKALSNLVQRKDLGFRVLMEIKP
ncbi:MAG: formylglycine-generating enzyme family protein [Verrucomicrobiia bacterium]